MNEMNEAEPENAIAQKEKHSKAIVECLLFVADSPLKASSIAQVIGIEEEKVRQLIKQLEEEYESQGRSFRILEIAEGYEFVTRHEYAPWIKKLYISRKQAKLSKASLETLAIIAYKQPLTRAEIEAVRGVDAISSLQTLLEKKLIKISGRKKVLGRPLLYRTTEQFLLYFSLKDLSELPRIEELRELGLK